MLGIRRAVTRPWWLVTITTAVLSIGAPALASGIPGGGMPAVQPAPSSPTSGARWVNHDNDHWGGWSDPANPGSAANPAGCDPIDPAQCMLPYPNDWFTSYDAASKTGRRLDLNPLAMPRNTAGKPIDPSAWNSWSDGFSAGAQILTVVPGMTSNKDLVPSGLPPITDLAMNSRQDLGVILLDADTGKTWPVWVEVDQYKQEAGILPSGAVAPVQQDLMIHPAANLLDGHRYIVGLRHLVTDSGSEAAPAPAFVAYRNGTAAPGDPRAAHMNAVFTNLAEAGWNRSSLYLAWDFTTASTTSVTGRLLTLRDGAFGQLGQSAANSAQGVLSPESKAPAFAVSSVTNFTVQQNARIARQVTGTFTVPCYIAPSCSPPIKCQTITAPTPAGTPFDDCPSPGEFALDPTDLYAKPGQVAGQTYQAGFICNVGRTAFDSRQLMRGVEYGHGLFGSASEVNLSPQEEMADRSGMVYCATDWFGFADSDIPNAVLALSDLSNFPLLADRTAQGELDFLYLQRLLVHPAGFRSSPAFQYPGGTSFLAPGQVFYDGNSQGGIFGGTVCAVSIDVKRCALGVNGMDYSILLPRSTDYVARQPLSPATLLTISPSNPQGDLGYSNLFDLFYPDQAQRLLILDLIQTLWDRTDPNGYATHMTSTAAGGLLPDTPDHTVLMQDGWADHQVADITAEDEARTIGASGIQPALTAARLCGTNDPGGPYCYDASSPMWGIPAITSFPYNGSAMVMFDAGPVGADSYGTNPPPPSDVPNVTGGDPHEAPRRACAAQEQKSDFLSVTGAVTEPPQPNGPFPPPYFSGGWQGTCSLP
ncbi:MAG TPA: hypothetical protein VMO88_09990 [Acidimicrobiales bacterium]|nr:hypothetical protein [Acidimicrobiales bacterium]